MSQYWKDAIHIPKTVQASDFVLKLTEGVTQAEKTVDSYVVTKGVADAFDKALGLIDSALSSNSSSATYLHGSFGAGKSHFMAVLDLLLDPEHTHLVRKLDNLAKVIVKHEEWLGKKKLMMVPYHFLGAKSMEERILGSYVDYVRKHHPDAPIPAVYASDKLVEDAVNMRAKVGDAKFFEMLGAVDEEASGWDDVGWDADSFDAAVAIDDPTDLERQRIVTDYITNISSAVMDLAAAADKGGGFIGIDEGLMVISQHAASLGYDGLLLFLDELILWLSRNASNTDFIQREGQKLAKLVEAQHADRPVPIISFVARQRSLSEFVGDAYTGLEKASFDFSLNWLQGRFNEVRLEDRDLPLIVKERLLKPNDAQSNERITQSFERFKKGVQDHHRDMMRTRDLDDDLFAKVYPFSPALVQSLVALSTFLQRERTALRLLLALLVKQRDSLRLGEVVPVGDLWDVVTEGNAPFSEALRRTYQQAVQLWTKKLKPMLNEQHGIDPDTDEEIPAARMNAWRNDARLLKTLLIAALVPEVDALRDMTISKLTALNYSAVKSPLPNMQETAVAQKVREWASQVGEIRISEDHNGARVSLQLSTLDVDILLDRVRTEDYAGSRKRKMRELLFTWMGLDGAEGTAHTTLQLDWRGGRRDVRVFYRNIRELSFDALEAHGDTWSMIVDYPFDEESHSPTDDQHNLDSYLEERPDGTDTVAWLPMFLSKSGKQRLGRLVKVEYVLDRFNQFSQDYSAEDRPNLRQQLESLRSALRTQLKQALEVAYGLHSGESELIDTSHNLRHHLYSLRPGHTPRIPAGEGFDSALRRIAEKAFHAKYPDVYPLPDERLTSHTSKKILGVIEGSLNAQDHRYLVEDHSLRKLAKHYAEAVDIGTMGENHFVVNDHWRDRIERELGDHDGDLKVGHLRDIIEPPDAPRGTPKVVQDLIICTYAMMEQMALVSMGAEQPMEPGKIHDGAELVRRELPSTATWEAALEVGRDLFGIDEEFPLLSAANVEAFVRQIGEVVGPERMMAYELPRRLEKVARLLGFTEQDLDNSARVDGAHKLREVFEALTGDATAQVESLVLHTQDAFARALIEGQYKHLQEHTALLQDSLVREAFSIANSREEDLSDTARTLLEQAREILAEPQHVQDLAGLKDRAQRLFRLLTDTESKPEPVNGSDTGGLRPETFEITSHAEFEKRVGTFRDALERGSTLTVTIHPSNAS